MSIEKHRNLNLPKVMCFMVSIIVFWWILASIDIESILGINDLGISHHIIAVIPIIFLIKFYNEDLNIKLKEMYVKINVRTLFLTLLFTFVYLVIVKIIKNTFNFDFDLMHLFRLLFLGLFEEMAFRGWGYNAFYSVFSKADKLSSFKLFGRFNIKKSELKAAIMSNLFFSIIHWQCFTMIYHYDMIRFISSSIQVFIIGIFFTFIFHRSKSIWHVIILHAFWDWIL